LLPQEVVEQAIPLIMENLPISLKGQEVEDQEGMAAAAVVFQAKVETVVVVVVVVVPHLWWQFLSEVVAARMVVQVERALAAEAAVRIRPGQMAVGSGRL